LLAASDNFESGHRFSTEAIPADPRKLLRWMFMKMPSLDGVIVPR
jgi:hypothetical protein